MKSEDLLSDSFLAAACTEALVDDGALVAKEVRALAGRTDRPPVKERGFRCPPVHHRVYSTLTWGNRSYELNGRTGRTPCAP